MASLFRRGLPALVLAGTGGVLLARFDHTEALTVETGAAPASAPAAPTTLPTLPTTTRPSVAAPTTLPTTPTTRPATLAPTTRPATVAPTTTVTPSSCTGAETLGPVIQTRWGPVQVAAIVVQGRICEVRALQVPSSHTRSNAINNRAVPILRERVLAAQSAAFDGVTGATVTSEGYRASLQAILNNAK